jgi:hypothetical protein
MAQRARRDTRPTPAHGRRPTRLAPVLWPALTVLLTAAVLGAPGDRPGIFLEGADIPRARALALDAALIKGWQVTASGRAHVVFETALEQPAASGPPGALPPERTTLRIRADFIATPAGVNTYLYAEEVWWPDTEREWVGDVTQRYRGNLLNALSSLERQWADYAARQRAAGRLPSAPMPAQDGDEPPRVRVEPAAPDLPPAPTTPAAAAPPAPAPGAVDIDVGTWAYYAEALAMERGCTLGDLGAELLSADGAGELHRVHCDDGSTLEVRCDRNGCALLR